MVDRTSEFLSTVEILRGTTPVKPVVIHRRASDDVDARVKLAAKDIARHVQMTAQLVEQLNRLVQRRSLFNDPAQQINDSTAVIKKNLSQQKAQLTALVKLTASRGGSEGSRAHWMQVAELLKLRLQVCMKGVQSALQTRAKNIKKIEAQKQRFNRSQWQPVVQLQKPMFSRHSTADTNSKAATSATTPREPHSAGAAGQAAYRVTADGADVGAATHTQPRPRPGAGLAKPSAVVERRNGNSGGVAASGGPQLGGGLRQRQGAQVEATPGGAAASYMTPGTFAAQTQMAAHTKARNRTAEALQVESSIVELGHMFSNLTNMVAEQAEVAREIEENMNLAEGYVQQGQTELLKWLQDVSRHRSLILKTFAILVVFILLFAFMNRG